MCRNKKRAGPESTQREMRRKSQPRCFIGVDRVKVQEPTVVEERS